MKKPYKNNLLLPTWVNWLLKYNLKPVVYFALVLALPIYTILNWPDPFSQFEADIELIRKA